jgi:hypothetical protein
MSLRSILILSTHLRLGLPSGLLPSGFPTNILYAAVFQIRKQNYICEYIFELSFPIINHGLLATIAAKKKKKKKKKKKQKKRLYWL